MKRICFFLTILLAAGFCEKTMAQNWSLTGNTGTVPASNFLGTADNKPVVFKSNNTERGRLLGNGKWQFGSSANNATIDSLGKLTFTGRGSYFVGNNRYIFRYASDTVKGLYLNSTINQYQFLNSSATPLFYVNGDNGNSGVLGTFKIGTYTLPSTDGSNGQVLTTNGVGTVSWSTIAAGGNSANKALSNLNATAVNQSLLPGVNNSIALGSGAKTWKDIYISGKLYFDNIAFLSTSSDRLSMYLGASSGLGATGLHNTAVGAFSLYNATTGNSNTATGYAALLSNTTGYQNTANGEATLNANTTGRNNTAVGFQSLTSNETGYSNAAIGNFALFSNQSGNDNVASGSLTMYNNISGKYNVATGTNTLYSNIAGSHNVALGNAALYNSIYNSANVALGDSTLFNYNDQDYNDYMVGVGLRALYANTTGFYNTAIGGNALAKAQTGWGNTALGTNADVTAGNLINATAIGYGAVVDASYKMRFGSASVTSIGGQVGWTTFSDGRYKKNIKENVKGLDFINALRPVTYTVDTKELDSYFHKGSNTNTDQRTLAAKNTDDASATIIHTGFIAQEVEAVAKKLNFEFDGVDKPKNEGALYGLRYDEFVVPLVKAVQELSKINEEKNVQLNDQQKQIDDLKKMLLQLQQQIKICSPCANAQSTENTSSITLTDNNVLLQNVPNPFTSTTIINYSLPQKYNVANISITDKMGRQIRTISVTGNGTGKLQVDGSLLSSGTYQYILIVDGKIIGSKQMIVIK